MWLFYPIHSSRIDGQFFHGEKTNSIFLSFLNYLVLSLDFWDLRSPKSQEFNLWFTPSSFVSSFLWDKLKVSGFPARKIISKRIITRGNISKYNPCYRVRTKYLWSECGLLVRQGIQSHMLWTGTRPKMNFICYEGVMQIKSLRERSMARPPTCHQWASCLPPPYISTNLHYGFEEAIYIFSNLLISRGISLRQAALTSLTSHIQHQMLLCNRVYCIPWFLINLSREISPFLLTTESSCLEEQWLEHHRDQKLFFEGITFANRRISKIFKESLEFASSPVCPPLDAILREILENSSKNANMFAERIKRESDYP